MMAKPITATNPAILILPIIFWRSICDCWMASCFPGLLSARHACFVFELFCKTGNLFRFLCRSQGIAHLLEPDLVFVCVL